MEIAHAYGIPGPISMPYLQPVYRMNSLNLKMPKLPKMPKLLEVLRE